MSSAMDSRIDALLSGGAFPQVQHNEAEAKKRARPAPGSADGLAEKYAHVKAQLATLDRTLRHELETHEETQAQLVRASQERDVLKIENGRLRAKVDELYLAITKLSECAAQDRRDAVEQALQQQQQQRGDRT